MQVVKLVSNDDAPKESRQTLVACHLNISVCFLKVGDAENALLHSSQVTPHPPVNMCQDVLLEGISCARIESIHLHVQRCSLYM
jgi:hypothetical protein